MEKQEIIEKLGTVKEEVDEYQKLIDIYVKTTNDQNEAISEMYDKALDGPNILIKFGALIAAAGMFFVGTIVFALLASRDNDLLFWLGLIIFIGLPIFTYVKVKNVIFDKQLERTATVKTSVDVDDLKEKAAALSLEMHEKLGFLPVDYCYPISVNKIKSYLSTGRTDDIKESINLLEEEIHREKLETQNKDYDCFYHF